MKIFTSLLITLTGLLISASEAQATVPFELTYSGRFVSKSGEPLKGPVVLSIEFYDAKNDGNLKGSTFNYSSVSLIDGIFQVTISLGASDFNTTFGATGETWIQVTDATHKVVYPRQRFFAVPYALKIPVDTSIFQYDGSGRLTLEQSALSGSQIISTINQSSDKISSSLLPALSGDVMGAPTTNKVTKIQNVSVDAPVSGTDNNKYLQFNGSAFVLSTVAGDGGIAEVTASSPISVANGTGTPAISISLAGADSGGYLSSADWNIFNGKQDTMSAATSGSGGYLTSSDWQAFNSKQANLGYTPLNKAGDTMSGPIIMGSQNDLRFAPASGATYVSLKAPATVSNIVAWTLPAADGAGGQVLSTNGSGILGWSTSTTGSVTNVSASGPLSVTNPTTTPAIAISQAGSGANGYLSSSLAEKVES